MRKRLSKKYGIWADPFMRPKTWTPEAAALAIAITKAKKEKADARLAQLKEKKALDRARTA